MLYNNSLGTLTVLMAVYQNTVKILLYLSIIYFNYTVIYFIGTYRNKS